jgi:Zn finger protein HypA/HybF involved in hydrogenase expression
MAETSSAQTSDGQPKPEAEANAGEPWRWCPRCGHELQNEKCKFRCPKCHYFMSCSDFD